MYQSAETGEIKKRHLHDADIAGLCHIYPEGEELPDPPSPGTDDNGTSSSSVFDGCGCAVTVGDGRLPSTPFAVAVVIALLGLIRMRGAAP